MNELQLILNQTLPAGLYKFGRDPFDRSRIAIRTPFNFAPQNAVYAYAELYGSSIRLSDDAGSDDALSSQGINLRHTLRGRARQLARANGLRSLALPDEGLALIAAVDVDEEDFKCFLDRFALACVGIVKCVEDEFRFYQRLKFSANRGRRVVPLKTSSLGSFTTVSL